MITILDFEASGLELPESYPIEVGIAQIHDDDTITSWGALIRQEPSWTHWNDKSETIHGISRDTLVEKGQDAFDVAMILNAALGTGTALVDGHRYDLHWANRLYAAAGIERTWELGSYDVAIYEGHDVSLDTVMKVTRHQRNTKVPHRAMEDAVILARQLLEIREIIAEDA